MGNWNRTLSGLVCNLYVRICASWKGENKTGMSRLCALLIAESFTSRDEGPKPNSFPDLFQATVEPLPGVLNVWKLDAGIKNRVYWPY